MPTIDEPGPGTGGPQEHDPFEGLVLDEEFVRAAGVKEPSGRARMLTARWQQEPPPENEPWRPVTEIRRSRWRRRARPVGGAAPRRHGVRNALLVLLVPVLVLVGLAFTEKHSTGVPESAALPTLGAATAVPSSAPPKVAPATATPEHPWAGSPADSWPAGPDGLALPAATAVGVFDQDRVAKDLALAKAFLVAANMDPQVMAGGYPQTAVDLTDRGTSDILTKELSHPTEEHDPASWASRFDPAFAVPVTDEVKVQGLITFEGDGEQGMLVHADVTFVYALRPGPQVGKATPSAPAPEQQPTGGGSIAKPVGLVRADPGAVDVQREIVRRKVDFRFADPARYQVKKDRLWLKQWSSSRNNTVCGFNGGYLRPSFLIERGVAGNGPSGGPTVDPYDWSRPLDESGDHKCGTASRS
ncbi:hypothetical protein [Kitasatospora sp. NPDC088134]|uniref:SCO2583/SCO2584 N-terminal domain-containing protein n=1 Tax=Kitasatospora sp. NPDC088134 TaxID=3364071 RepID=UPI0037F53DA4